MVYLWRRCNGHCGGFWGWREKVVQGGIIEEREREVERRKLLKREKRIRERGVVREKGWLERECILSASTTPPHRDTHKASTSS